MLIGQGQYILSINGNDCAGYSLYWYDLGQDQWEAALMIDSWLYADPECALASRAATRVGLHDISRSACARYFIWPTSDAAEAAHDAIVEAVLKSREVSHEA